MKWTFDKNAIRLGYRSGLEAKAAEQLELAGISYEYEHKDKRISYEKPTTQHKYSPDFTFNKSQIIIETKGQFKSEDRKKHLLIKKQHPKLDIRFVFSNMNGKIGKKSSTTYAMWAERNGFKYAHKTIPQAWIEEIKKGK